MLHSRNLTFGQMRLLCAALLLGTLLALCAGTWFRSLFAADRQLQADTLRLHVRAASNTVLDQTAKLAVRDAVLGCLAAEYGRWRREGFAAVLPRLAVLDCLRGRLVTVRQTADDPEPVRGVCAGIGPDGTLLVGDSRVYAGEAHVMTGEEV